MKGAESTLPVGSNERKLLQHGFCFRFHFHFRFHRSWFYHCPVTVEPLYCGHPLANILWLQYRGEKWKQVHFSISHFLSMAKKNSISSLFLEEKAIPFSNLIFVFFVEKGKGIAPSEIHFLFPLSTKYD